MFILVEKARDELVYLYAKVVSTAVHLHFLLSFLSFLCLRRCESDHFRGLKSCGLHVYTAARAAEGVYPIKPQHGTVAPTSPQ